ncbi:MAG: HAD-IB family hydrolase [Gammaproteobacteria bacterium]|jgi:putative phosphoserine phosphatase/1-acylglycerol-3-phosphate O-acyltransferase|nr:HAD-IB family hydrolase [Gammaproteobacteria bacterium]MBP6050253.1 HAD-IB family hydrolase [Pseudomonadales bacterium]MBK6583827.1 HAD-IB family hydrolase [Gammaproteobacteria bacterium]MBK7522164.1 HAD-IB family hydrolase [Gammaproteobacteria bacterium]MBK7727363.1 HAD-IB family hydrolase [Gammaproteobacteria bacterium]
MYGHLTESIDRSAAGPHIGALFDLDRTLLEGFSVFAFLQQRLMSGTMTPREMQANAAAFANYSLGKTGFSGMLATTTRALRGVAEKSLEEVGEDTFENNLASRIYPEARALVEAHRRKGHTLAIISSATRYQIAPVAQELGIEHVLCTRLEVVDGVFTGEIVPPPCWKEGKAEAARELARTHGLKLEKSYFYTDASEDLPLLEIVGHPHPLNPDRELALIAERRDWPVHRFAKRKTGFSETLRTGLAYGGMLPAILAGVPVRLLGGSARQAANVTIATWSDFASAAIGLDIRIIGREHLWSRRPAVFVFNHQSAADVMIIGRLLRQDFTGIAKIEASRALLSGTLLKAAGTVFIDRADRGKALEALQPAVEALRNGTSLAIAPEGTRSETAALGAFKKGAFHMAMQAGVPVVPIVIHNALDVQPKGESVFRPATVYVEVLAPIATTGWSARGIDKHVAEVRDLFLRALGQPAGPTPPKRRAPRKAAARSVTRRKAART